jgi:hypothetical protein
MAGDHRSKGELPESGQRRAGAPPDAGEGEGERRAGWGGNRERRGGMSGGRGGSRLGRLPPLAATVVGRCGGIWLWRSLVAPETPRAERRDGLSTTGIAGFAKCLMHSAKL